MIGGSSQVISGYVIQKQQIQILEVNYFCLMIHLVQRFPNYGPRRYFTRPGRKDILSIMKN